MNEEYIKVFETILHSAALHELEKISFKEHIEHCQQAVAGKVKNKNFYHEICEYVENESLIKYKNLGTFSKALNRADSFLFSLAVLDIGEQETECILEQWYALLPSLLLMDDIMDLKEDLQNNHENSILDFGEGSSGVEKAVQFLREKFQLLKRLNTELGEHFERSLEKKIRSPYLQSILNPQ